MKIRNCFGCLNRNGLYIKVFALFLIIPFFFTGCETDFNNENSKNTSVKDEEEKKNPKTGSIEGKAFYSNSDDCSGIIITLESTDGIRTASVIQFVSCVKSSNYERAVISADRAIEASYVTKSDGKYSFSNLTPGTYTIYASSMDSTEKAVSTNVVVQSERTVTVDDLKLTATGKISGRITIDNSEENNYGFIVYIAGTSFSAMTDNAGNFLISDIPADSNYSLIISRGSFLYFWRKGVTVRANQTLSLDDKNFALQEVNVDASGSNGADGKDGENGKDGVSIVWRGSFASAIEIENPQVMNAYYNTTDGCSYIYDGAKWNLLAKAGADGTNGENGNDGSGKDGTDGKDGVSIIWRGSFASVNDIETPQAMNAYYNITDGCSYIYDGAKWDLLAKAGADGANGEKGTDGSGKDGTDGKDGVSIVWRGSFASANEVENPQLMNAYYNTTDGCSYIYDGEKWTLLAKSGADGTNGENGTDGSGKDGKDGVSIVWRGSFASANEIENPQAMNAYYNTTDGCSYIYDGEKWNLLAKSGNTEIYNSSLELSTLPSKLNYYLHENLDLSGLVVCMNKTDGSSVELSKDEYSVEPSNGTELTETGSRMIKVVASGKTVVFIINVTERTISTIENIVLNTTSVNRYYGKGESLDLSALKITALYSDGTSSELTNYTSIPENGSVLNNLGLQTITILAEGKSASFDIQVLPDSSIYAQVSYEVYSDIANLMSYDSISHSFTALPNYDSYRWYVDDVKQKETSNIFIYEDCKYHTVMVIVNAAGAYYSAQTRIE